jgi:hypothetical protein
MAQSNQHFFSPTPNTEESPSVAAAEGVLPTEAAYEALLPEILALADNDLTPINVDVMSAIITVTGALPELRSLRSEIEAAWRQFDFQQFDKLESYALALNHAHSRHRSSVAAEGIGELVTELTTQRDQLLANATSLATSRLINAERLKHVKKANGYRALASDVLTLCTVYRDDWSRLEGKTPFSKGELVRIGKLALELLSVVALREQALAVTGETALIRQKAFTLFVRAYEDARRAVHYLRAKVGDGDRIAPSLYAGRATRRRADEPELEVLAPAPLAAAPASGSGAESAPSSSTPSIVIDNVAGLPIDNPFSA